MSIAQLSDRDLRSLVKFGSDERIMSAARTELEMRETRPKCRGMAHNHDQAGLTPAPATTIAKGRWD